MREGEGRPHPFRKHHSGGQRSQLMGAGCSDLDTFDVGRVEGLSSQPHRHQYDDRLPGLAGWVRGSLA